MFDTLTDGNVLLADRTYDSDALRAEMASRGVSANVRAMPLRTRPPALSSYLYKLRNLVERFFSKIKHYRAVATRYQKHPKNYLAVIKLAAARIWMRFMSRGASASNIPSSIDCPGLADIPAGQSSVGACGLSVQWMRPMCRRLRWPAGRQSGVASQA